MGKRTSKTTIKKGRKRAAEAAGSYRGFSLQATRFLHYLMVADPPDAVCLEIIDDVSVNKSGGATIAEQDKSYLKSNPLADRSVAFWKTLRNWVDLATRGGLDPARSRFILYAPGATPASLAKHIHEANNDSSVRSAIATMESHVNALKEVDAEWRMHAQVTLAAKRTVLPMIVRNFTLETPTQDAHKSLRPLFVAKLISEEALDDTIAWAHGWVKKTVDALLEKGQPARVVQGDFQAALLNYVKLHDRLIILRSFAGVPNQEDVNSELAFRCYVRQLRIIDLNDIDILAAVNDYLRASIDRTEWSNRGFINEVALDTFQAELITMWRNKRHRSQLLHADRCAEHQGQLLYSECIEHRLSLDGLETPDAFLRGSLHALSDDRAIGWHPTFTTLLDQQ